MNVQINDCTIRDGGYLLNKNSDPEFIKGVINGLIAGGIDIIESGFLQTKTNGESIVYRNSVDAMRFMPEKRGISHFTGFCDNSRYSIENLDDCTGKSFDYLRISFAKHEWKDALRFASNAAKKGYKVFVNPMDAPGYTAEERAEVITEVNTIKPYAFSIVDTFGAMYLEDLHEIFAQVDKLLDKSIRIGLHSHNNLQLSCALAEVFIDLAVKADRDVVVDGSLYGMGRGAGNALTEVIANYLNKKCGKHYDESALFDTIEKYIEPLTKDVFWGYNLPMFVCGFESSHVDNVYHLQQSGCTAREMYKVLDSMDKNKRRRYGSHYSKDDFTELDKVYEEYKKN